jgi:hypothetical protein
MTRAQASTSNASQNNSSYFGEVHQAEGELDTVILLRPPPPHADYRHPLNYSYKHRNAT